MTRQLPINQPFDLALSLTMGQALRWYKLPPDFYGDGHKWFSGVLGENLIHISQVDGLNGPVRYRIGGPDGERSATVADNDMLRCYFREDDDIAAIYADISNQDDHIAELVRKYPGMRVLRQEPWECLVSYICSRSNKIPNIKQCVSEIATLTRQTMNLGDDERRSFPTPERILEVKLEALIELEFAGRFNRDFPSAILAAAQRVHDGQLDFDAMKSSPYSVAIQSLMQGKMSGRKVPSGIGAKIADCVALMSLDQLEAFPVDTHIRKLVNERWFGWEKPPTDTRISRWAQDCFGLNAGYAGQFIFCDRAQAGDRTAASTSRRKFQDTAKSRSRSFEDHRARQCPFCGAPPGSHCKTPGGHYLLQGHKDRRSRAQRTIRNARRRRSPGSAVRRRLR